MLKLYGNYKSGNVYKVSLALHMLNIPYEEVQIGLGPDTESQTPEFLNISPLGQIPVLQTEDGRFIWQSNAILWFLAQETELLPSQPYEQAVVLQWMFFEQYELEPNLAMARWICHLKNDADNHRDELRRYHQSGYRALGIVEKQLAERAFIVGDGLSIADVALFAYVHNCHQGQMSLAEFAGIRRWIEAIKRHAGYFPMSEQFSRFDYQ